MDKFHATGDQEQAARRGSSAGSGASAVRSVLAGAGAGAGAGSSPTHQPEMGLRREISELALPLEADVLATLDQPDALEVVELEVRGHLQAVQHRADSRRSVSHTHKCQRCSVPGENAWSTGGGEAALCAQTRGARHHAQPLTNQHAHTAPLRHRPCVTWYDSCMPCSI